MQRQIKFRAWDKKEMVYFDLAGRIYAECPIFSDIDKDAVLMQFTGLKDKNGNEIYEGDIIDNGNGPVYVFWNENYQAFWVGHDDVEESEKQYYSSTSDFCTEADVIIGNIYSNPELLEVVNHEG